jgi:hypothetical protein
MDNGQRITDSAKKYIYIGRYFGEKRDEQY